MPNYMIERQVPGASRFTQDELQSISRRSVGVLRQLGPEIQWVESYVAGDNLYCVYVAPDEEMVREHGRLVDYRCQLQGLAAATRMRACTNSKSPSTAISATSPNTCACAACSSSPTTASRCTSG
jgi:hypothetical protein